jgi:hypothetical protein
MRNLVQVSFSHLPAILLLFSCNDEPAGPTPSNEKGGAVADEEPTSSMGGATPARGGTTQAVGGTSGEEGGGGAAGNGCSHDFGVITQTGCTAFALCEHGEVLLDCKATRESGALCSCIIDDVKVFDTETAFENLKEACIFSDLLSLCKSLLLH